MTIPLSRRQINAAGIIICVLMMGYALYSQHIKGLEPCPLCIVERIALIGIGIVFTLAVLVQAREWGRYVIGLLFAAAAGFGIAVAGRHVWLQNLPPDQVPECSMMSLDYMISAFPFTEVLNKIFKGSGECAEIVWQFLGLSMPTWVLIWFVILGVVGIANNLRQP